MTSLEVLGHAVAVLDDLGVEHMLVGAFSAIAYGVARATKDADFVVACEPRDVSRIAEALGPDYSLDWEYLRRWTDLHGTTQLLDQLRGEATE